MTTRNSDDSITSAENTQPRVFKRAESIDLSANTLGIVGPSMLGPAFVPQTFRTYQEDTTSNGILNTYENVHGSLDNMSEVYPTQFSVYEWFNQGGSQASFVRILGLGDTGIENEEGIVEGSGFEVGKQIISGSNNKHFVGSNPNSEGDYRGRVNFIGCKYKDNDEIIDNDNIVTAHADYISQINDDTEDIFLINDVVFCPSGSQLLLQETPSANISVDRIRRDLLQAEDQNLVSNNTVIPSPFIFVKDLKSIEKNTINNYNNDFKLDTIVKRQFNEDFFNYNPKRILEKGHLNYTSFYQNHSLLNKTMTFIVTGSNESVDYENFKSIYKTAKTPWIVTQPLNREGIADNRQDLHKKCKKIFRFFAMSDGKSGNNFRIRITPQRLGNCLLRQWSKFKVHVSRYDESINEFINILSYEDLDLNPNSKDYIGRVFGDEHEFLNLETGKIEKKGIYTQKNNHLRVEMSESIEFGKIKDIYELMPSGFMPYPRLNTTDLSFNNNSIYQMPMNYMWSLLRSSGDHIVLEEEDNRYWGVCFDNTRLKESPVEPLENQSLKQIVLVRKQSTVDNIRNFKFYSKYFQNSFIDKNKNVWVTDLEDDNEDRSNSFFHLEKILYLPKDNGNFRLENWKYAMYRRDGKNPASITTLRAGNSKFKYLNVDEALKSDNESDSAHSQFLSFDFFTYGGFDGVNILDNDKNKLNQTAFLREIDDETNSQKFDGPTTFAYRKGHDLLVDDANSDIDLLCLPEVGHNAFNKRISDIANSNNRYLAILNVPDFTDEGLFKDFEDFYEVDLASRQDGVRQEFDFDAEFNFSADLSVSEASSMYFSNKFTLNVCNIINASINKDNIPDNKFVLMPAYVAIKSFARSLNLPPDSLYEFNRSFIDLSSLWNEDFADSDNNNFSRIVKNSQDSRNNINFIIKHTGNSRQNLLKLNSANTSIFTRNSLNRLSNNIRIMLDIKKNIKYRLYTSNILFEVNTNTENKNIVLNILLNNVLSGYKDSGIIKDYFVSLNIGNSAKSRLEKLNNILSGKVAISLFGKEDREIQEFTLADIMNTVQNNLTDINNQDILYTDV